MCVCVHTKSIKNCSVTHSNMPSSLPPSFPLQLMLCLPGCPLLFASLLPQEALQKGTPVVPQAGVCEQNICKQVIAFGDLHVITHSYIPTYIHTYIFIIYLCMHTSNSDVPTKLNSMALVIKLIKCLNLIMFNKLIMFDN